MANDKNKVTASDVLKEKDQNEKEKKYNKYVKDMTPKHNGFTNLIRAFFVGAIVVNPHNPLSSLLSLIFAKA